MVLGYLRGKVMQGILTREEEKEEVFGVLWDLNGKVGQLQTTLKGMCITVSTVHAILYVLYL